MLKCRILRSIHYSFGHACHGARCRLEGADRWLAWVRERGGEREGVMAWVREESELRLWGPCSGVGEG